jgi:hypothetical protein
MRGPHRSITSTLAGRPATIVDAAHAPTAVARGPAGVASAGLAGWFVAAVAAFSTSDEMRF